MRPGLKKWLHDLIMKGCCGDSAMYRIGYEQFCLCRNKADRHKSRAPSNQRPTDGRTDGRADEAAYRVACTRLKIKVSHCTHGDIKY